MKFVPLTMMFRLKLYFKKQKIDEYSTKEKLCTKRIGIRGAGINLFSIEEMMLNCTLEIESLYKYEKLK